MKISTLILAIFLACGLNVAAQENNETQKYLTGAVPTKNGMVEFSKTYNVAGKSQAELYELLKNYTQKEIVEGENHLNQARITELDSINGVIAASVEENLYFKKKNWVSDFTRFFYQLIFQIENEKFTVTMRRIHYVYEQGASPESTVAYRAEELITDDCAFNRSKTKLAKFPGKFRRFTIDRKDEIFKGAARACGALKKVQVVMEVEE